MTLHFPATSSHKETKTSLSTASICDNETLENFKNTDILSRKTFEF